MTFDVEFLVHESSIAMPICIAVCKNSGEAGAPKEGDSHSLACSCQAIFLVELRTKLIYRFSILWTTRSLPVTQYIDDMAASTILYNGALGTPQVLFFHWERLSRNLWVQTVTSWPNKD